MIINVFITQAHGGDTKDQLTTIVHEKERLRTELSNVQMELSSSNDKVKSINVTSLSIIPYCKIGEIAFSFKNDANIQSSY